MIELTPQQCQSLADSGPGPTTVVNPTTNETYVLLRRDLYEQLASEPYDDSPWTEEEMELLAWEAGRVAGWEDMDEYDEYEKNP